MILALAGGGFGVGLGRSIVLGLMSGGIYGLLAIGIVLIYKGSRVLNFAQGEIGTAALFVAWMVVTNWHLPWIAGAVAAVGAAVLLGLVFERLVVRPMGESSRLSVAIATVGLTTLLFALEQAFFGPSPRILPPPVAGLGLQVLGVYVGPSVLIALGVVAAIGAGLAAMFRFTDFGLSVLAAAQDSSAARLMGVRLGRVSAFTWAAGAAIAAIAALLIEPNIGVFAPGYVSEIFVRSLAAALVGGLTSLSGAFAGGIVVGLLEAEAVFFLRSTDLATQLGTNTIPGLDLLTIFVLIVLVLLVRPQGLFARGGARVA
jgi:branched-chain amino acid transport system permease protein